MSLNRTFSVFLIILSQFWLFSQMLPARPFEKIEYPDLIPEWHFVNYDPDIDKKEFDGYNNFILVQGFEPKIENNAIFEILFKQSKFEPTGTYIQKIDLNDGLLIWRKFIGYPSDVLQILGRNILINSKGNLEVISQVKCEPNDNNFSLLGRDNMALYKIELNIINGSTIDETMYNCNDSMYLQSNFDLLALKNVSKFYSIRDNFFYTQAKWANSNWEYRIYKLFDNFKSDSSIIKSYVKKYNCPGDLPVFYNDSTRIVFNSNCKSKQMEMTFLDENLNEIKTVVSDSLSSKLNDLQVIKFDPIYRRLMLENVISFEKKEIEILIIDLNGKLLKRIFMPSIYNRNYCLLDWNDIDNLIFLASKINYLTNGMPYVSLDVLRNGQNEDLAITSSHVASDSLRYLSYINLVNSDENYYYLQLNESSIKKSSTAYSNDINASAKSLMKLKKEQIFKHSATLNPSLIKKLKCSPNPTSDIVNISGLSNPTSLAIIDINGRLLNRFENVQNQVNIDFLPKGIYFFSFKNPEFNEFHRIVKVE